MNRLGVALACLLASASVGAAYSKPTTYNETFHVVVFKDRYLLSPHSWAIARAIYLIEKDGFATEAAVARKYLLPMLEGVTYNDVWGDADLAGGSILDYYVPDPEGTGDHNGFGCAVSSILNIFAYKNCTDTFESHAFYGYENAAEEAQFRYDYAKRIYGGQWGSDARDMMAGWVIDELGVFGPGQEDPQNGRWASGTSAIDAATAPDGTQSRFGTGQTPAMALLDLLQNNTTAQVVFGDETDDALSTIHVPTTDVLENHGPGWLDDRFGDADDVEAYNGYDGHGYAVYANWTLDTGGHCNNGECAAPMVVRLPVGSKAHAFFNLGWAIHLVEDNTTPVHTTSDSITTSEVHNDIEGMADRVLDSRISVPAGSVDQLLPTLTAPDFAALYDYPPSNCADQLGSDADPAGLYKTRWYAKPLSQSDPDVLVPAPGEGVAHAYTRQAAMTMHRYMPYISCINTEDDANWPTMGFFTALGLDLEVKAVAGVIRQFIEDVDTTLPTVTIVRPTATAYPHFGTLTLSYSATDDESGIKSGSVTATIDGNSTLGTPPHGLASGQPINLLTELSLGAHTFQVSATDNASNVSSPSVTFTLIVTASSIIDDVNYFLSTGAISSKNEANSLLKKLQAAAAYRAKGDCKDASATYAAFINEVRAQTGKTISATAATIMIGDAQYLVSNCP